MDFLKRHRSLIALLAAVYAVWRYGRYLALGWLQLRNVPFVDGPVRFLLGHWEVAAVLGAVIFIGVLAGVRFALGQGRRDHDDGDEPRIDSGTTRSPRPARSSDAASGAADRLLT